MKPSGRFVSWLESQLRERRPGTRLPTTSELAAQWNLSAITISRLLAPFHRDGRIVRIPRRGTFIGPLDTPSPQGRPQPTTSIDSIVASVKHSITSGSLRKGDALPSLKFMSRQFNVASRSVGAAYRHLEAQTHVARVGKTWWVGSFVALTKHRPNAEIAVVSSPRMDLGVLFTEPLMGLAMRKFEKELVDHGFRVCYFDQDAFRKHTEEWRRDQRRPSGIVLARMFADDNQCSPGLVAPLCATARDPVPLLAIVDTGDYRLLPRGTVTVSRGNVDTMVARELAHYRTATRFSAVQFFVDFDGHNLFDIFVPVKTRSEIRSFDDSFTTTFHITTRTRRSLSYDKYVELWRRHTVPDYRKDAIVGKYGTTGVSEVEREFVVRTSAPPYASLPRGLWVFTRDSRAAEALEWARSTRVRVPGELSIVSLENNPAYYHLGISSLVLDWNAAGYLMAHALMGDIEYERTGKGFLRLGVSFIHRLTSRADA